MLQYLGKTLITLSVCAIYYRLIREYIYYPNHVIGYGAVLTIIIGLYLVTKDRK